MPKAWSILSCCSSDTGSAERTDKGDDLPNRLSTISSSESSQIQQRISPVPAQNKPALPPDRIDPWQDRADLWDEAYRKLEAAQPNLFKKYEQCVAHDSRLPDTESLVDIDDVQSNERERYLAAQIEKRLQTIQKEEWTTASQVYKKTVKTVLFAKDFIAQVASNEPHAALAWAGVSMFLPLLLKPDAQRQAATEGLADISDLMIRYRVVEKTFRNRSKHIQLRQSEDQQNLILDTQNKIVGLYTQILEFQLRLASYYSQHTGSLKRYMKDLVTSDDWQGMQTTIDATHQDIKENLGAIGDIHFDKALEEQTKALQNFMEQSIPLLKSLDSGFKNFVASEAQKAILDHLAPESEGVDYKKGLVYGHWHPSSGEWLKMSKEYQTWWSSKGGFMWAFGVAGSGKTVLANIIGEDLSARYSADADKQIVRIFFDYLRASSRLQCWASLWRQFASRRPFDDEEIALLRKTYVEQQTKPNEAKWKDMLRREARGYSRVFLIVDALDESKVDDPLQFVDDLISLLPNANFMVTTRPNPKIDDLRMTTNVTTIEIKAHRTDLATFVDERLSKGFLLEMIRKKPNLKTKIRTVVLDVANDM
ncbi:MAG: hypothetical protein Q9160_008652 [Pyrenula sp. 1 TL-2023]